MFEYQTKSAKLVCIQVYKELELTESWREHWHILEDLGTRVAVSSKYQSELSNRIQRLEHTVKTEAKVFLEDLVVKRKDREIGVREVFVK
jgi:hypothetical protein